MRYQIFFVGLIFIIFIPYQSEANNKCFTAKTCLHNAKEICGEDHNQGTRRFFDTCDMKEYNCLQGTSYVKVSLGHCRNLPPIEEKKSTEKKLQKNKEMPNDDQDAEKSLQIDEENSKQEQDAENSLEIHEENSRQEQDEEKTTEKYEDNSKQEKEAEESLQIHEANSNQEQDTEKSLHIQEESSKQEQDAESTIGEAQDAAKLKAEDVKMDNKTE
ncbi:regulator of nonsense transcripts 2-like [Vanessa tameamea]|uniref:Regulator of nonsense transcripts 2-like n=1 Tax=Vanessa tameamea TaxID=334116 RepID=A0ABM4ASD9_VANTA